MGKSGIISVIVIIVVMVGGVLFFGSSNSDTTPKESVPIGTVASTEAGSSSNSEPKISDFDKVPQFELEDNNGNTITPNDFPGKILVVNSWATWCPFCVNELPDFVELQDAFPDDIVVIAIDRAESKDISVGYIDNLGLTSDLVWLLDPGDSFYRSIGGFSMPETLFVDSDGNIRVHKRGPMDIREMTEKIESLL